MAALLGPEIFSRGFRFNPTPLEAAAYYLPRLIAGAPLHEAVRPVVHRADVYACEPADLARQFRPMPRTGHRFFFTSCSRRGVRAAGPGFWSPQKRTTDIKDGAGAKVGEMRKLRYRKRGAYTDWLMDEYSTCCSEDAVVGDRQHVFCNVYVSPRAAPDSAARQESAAFVAPPAPASAPAVIAQAAAPKRPAPQAAEPPKRTRGAVAAPTPPIVQPAASSTASLAPPRLRVPNRGVAPPSTPSVTGPSPASAQPPAPAPPRLAAPPPATPQPKQQMPQPTLPVVRTCHMPVQEEPAHHFRPRPSAQTKELRDEAEKERVVRRRSI